MKRFAAALTCILLCASCTAPQPLPEPLPEPQPEPAPELSQSVPEPSQPEPDADIIRPLPEEEDDGLPEVYIPEGPLSLEETARAYIEQTYTAYLYSTDIDLSAILDTSKRYVRDMVQWSKNLNQRRRLLLETGLCYVPEERYPYEIEFIDESELADERIENWTEFNAELLAAEELVHFTIRGEPGRAYPPQMAVNTQHSMRMRQVDGVWKITVHYFPGSVRKYMYNPHNIAREDEAVLRQLAEEFAVHDEPAAPLVPMEAVVYDGPAAADYARAHAEVPNRAFYNVGDWIGDCANFTSQCIWTGFCRDPYPDLARRPYMTEAWYAGEGGGSPAWENVDHFWSYLMEERELRATVLEGVSHVREGDLIQSSSWLYREDDDGETGTPRYGHSLIVVDQDTLLLAQHSPGCLVYYADLVCQQTRFARPEYLYA